MSSLSTATAASQPNLGASHHDMANAIRALSMDAVQKANSGHPGMPMGMADVATVLWSQFLKHDPEHPFWPDRDRFVLSAGHGSMLLYSLMYLTGYEDITLDEIKNFRQKGARTAGHPEYGHAAGIETTTGPLGQGIANAVGMALAERMLEARYGDAIVNHYTYAIAGDGCLMEGISHEAASLAGHLKLSKLIVLFDDNGISIDGPTSLTVSDDTLKRFDALGWDTAAIDGHDPKEIHEAILRAKTTDKPSLIACRTTIAFGAPTKAGTSSSHGSPLGDKEIAGTREALGWTHGAFDVPSSILEAWRASAQQGKDAYDAWANTFDHVDEDTADTFSRVMSGELPEGWVEALENYKQQLAQQTASEATRKSSQNVLEVLTESIPELVGGSADLTGSNNTKSGIQQPISAQDFSGSYIYYGVREHAMGAMMNGIALHGGFIPYGGTFLVFTDYCRSAIRLSALMQQRVIYVMTHDSIGLGEDGPTHQPVEHLASLRAIPNLHVFRPADATETLECWALSVSNTRTPSLLALSRQNLIPQRQSYTADNLCALGGYVLREAANAPVTIIATGSEVEIAAKAVDLLSTKGITARLVSMPCMELFDAQPADYKQQVLGTGLRVVVEAGIRMCWDKYLGERGIFIGVEDFGMSAPAPEVYAHFGITPENICERVQKTLA
jgi:transketolase